MINKFNEFNLDKDVDKFISLIETMNESIEIDNFISSMSTYLETVLDKGYDYLGKFLNKVFKYFSLKRSVIVFILLILITKLGCSPDKVMSVISLKHTEKSKLISEVKAKYTEDKHNVEHFLKAIADRESGGDPTIVNKLGYIGKYQFNGISLKDIHHKDITSKFKKNPKIWPEVEQDKAMIKLLNNNKYYLRDYINKYNGKVIKGIKITESGMLAGAHLLGASNVKKFLNSNGNINPSDGFGTKLTEYLSKFGGYNLNIL